MAPVKKSNGPRHGQTKKPQNPKKGTTMSVKREKTKFHAKKFAEKKRAGGGQPGSKQLATKEQRAPRSAATKHVDLHLASKISHEFANDINQFKAKLQNFQLGKLDQVTELVPPSFIMQHLPSDVAKFRTYFPRFLRGSSNHVLAFLKWFEWAEFEMTKGKTFHAQPTTKDVKAPLEQHHDDGDDEGNDDGEDEAARGEGGRKKVSAARAAMAETVKEREHMRSLLHMCLRHNSTKRREGQHALINHLNSHLTEHVVGKTAASLRGEVHQSIYYALSRLLLGMATENFAHVILNCQVIQLALAQTSLTPKSMLSMLDEVLTLGARMKAVELRLQQQKSGRTDDDDGDIDPEDINDPTKGERNQRVQAAIFALAAIFASDKPLSAGDIHVMIRYLCFCFVEHKGLRVFAANLILKILRRHGASAVQDDAEVWKWLSFTFFHFPKLEYYRPEGVQLLMFFMSQEQKPSLDSNNSNVALRSLLDRDPLEPTMLEEIANALFRKEQVTLVHPMIHPVWQDLLDMIVKRCAEGESMKQHLTTLVHTVIAPYRRGSADSPRRALFIKLVDLVGKMALLHDDEEDRNEVVKIAVKTVGFGKHQSSAKPTDPAVLRALTADQMNDKVSSLLRQLAVLSDNEPGALHTRSWALKELKSCLLIPVREGVSTPYVDTAVLQLLQHGLFPPKKTTDEASMNRATYLFAETFSFTFSRRHGSSMLRPKTTVDPTRIIAMYLEAEEKNKTRFRTAVDHVKFRKARNKIVTALDNANTSRSVLFYESRDMLVMLTLIFVLLSVDDPTNESALTIAKSVTPDLVRFFEQGTIETLDIFYDATMALVMRTSVPTHAVPIMACIRRIATGLLIRFASFLKSRKALDIVLAPLVDGFGTNDADDARNRLEEHEDEPNDIAEAEDAKSSSSESEEEDEESDASSASDEDNEADDNSDEEAASDASGNTEQDDDEDASTEADDSASEVDADAADSEDESADSQHDEDDEEWESETRDAEDAFEEEELPTQQYINSLQQLAGNVDLGFAYPTDTEGQEKSTVLRAIHIAARIGLQLRSPIVVHVYQVLLAVMRSTVKQDDAVIFNGAKSAIEMLFLSRQRYFGYFLAPEELFQILGDVQSNLRKITRLLISKDQATTRRGPLIRKRMNILKQVSLQVMHFLAYLAQKNHADEPLRITFSEFYASVYYDRGWETKSNLYQLKRDLYHYRHAFAWAFLPAVVEKFNSLKLIDGAKRVTAFNGTCAMLEATLPRVSGLPLSLKQRVGNAVSSFLFGSSLSDIFAMKHTALYSYFRAMKFAVEYNSKLQLNLESVSERVDEVTDNDDLQVTAATIRIVSTLEKLLNKTSRVKETKAPVPVQVLHRQFQPTWKKAKSEFYKKQKAAKRSVSEALLAHRNQEPTDEERAKKRRRREELKVRDQEERKVLREVRSRELTKEEKDERRKRMEMAKQDRIAKNKDRKRRIRDAEAKSFQRWKAAKLEE